LSPYAPFLAALVCLVVGLSVGKAWERYKLRSGRLVDRRKMPESLHYILGLNFLVTNQLDLAIEELNKAAEHLGDALEIHLLLGSLYREKGQVARAINIHQSLLQRPQLTRLEQSHVLLCLGLDFKRGGFVDRALEAFNEVLKLDPENHYALVNIEKLHEDQHQWQEAYDVRRSLGRQSGGDGRSQSILAFLENELGLQALAHGDYSGAVARFKSAIDLDASAVPAHLNLGDVYARDDKMPEAVAVWEHVIDGARERAYLAFDRLAIGYARLGNPERFAQLCRKLISGNPQDWRARLALARHLEGDGDSRGALEQLFEALVHNPHALSVHQAIW
jgi:lipopolysaccharide assembly protein B